MKPDTPLNEEAIAARGRELNSEKWQLPKRYRLQSELLALPPEELKRRDPEMHALWERIQADEKRLAASAAMPFEQMSSQDTFRARAAQRAEEMRVQIYQIDQEIGKALTTGEGDVAKLQSTKLALRHRRAQELAALGRFDLAAKETPHAEFRSHYLTILDAVWRPNDEWCDCGDVRGSGEHANVTVPTQYVKEEVFSVKEGAMVFLLACGKCGTLNATPLLPNRLREQRAHRERARQIAGKELDPLRAAALLERAGLTSKAVMK